MRTIFAFKVENDSKIINFLNQIDEKIKRIILYNPQAFLKRRRLGRDVLNEIYRYKLNKSRGGSTARFDYKPLEFRFYESSRNFSIFDTEKKKVSIDDLKVGVTMKLIIHLQKIMHIDGKIFPIWKIRQIGLTRSKELDTNRFLIINDE